MCWRSLHVHGAHEHEVFVVVAIHVGAAPEGAVLAHAAPVRDAGTVIAFEFEVGVGSAAETASVDLDGAWLSSACECPQGGDVGCMPDAVQAFLLGSRTLV